MKVRPMLGLLLGVAVGFAPTGCRRSQPAANQPAATTEIETVPAKAWSALARQRVFFGHQSVGAEIMAGIETVIARQPRIALRVREIDTPATLEPGVLAHGRVGRNGSYRSKLEAFTTLIDSELGSSVEIALLKFCFVDILSDADPESIFRDYETTLDELRQRHPDTTFVHVSAPLTWHLSGPRAALRKIKDLVKGALGRPTYGQFFDNGARNRFNALLYARYSGSEPLFDLAAVESTRLDGSRVTYQADGATYFAMAPEYTGDGGHLNELGRRRAAERLLLLLARVAQERETRGAASAARND